VLFGLWLWQAFYWGGFMAHQWLPLSLAAGLFGLVIFLVVAYPRRPRQLSLAVLTLFGLYAAWTACSALWADSVSRVWLEATRTGTFLLVFALALIYLSNPGARRSFRYLLMSAALFLLGASIWELWSTNIIGNLFMDNRFFFPVTYPNNAAALFLVGFWPLLWLASGPEERAPVRGLALGLVTGLLGLAVMTQSRGAIWSLGLTVVFAFIISPARLRTLLYLAVPILLLVYEFPTLNRYWSEGPIAVGGEPAARVLLVASVTAVFIGMILALLERWIRVSGKVKLALGSLVLVVVVAGAIFGSITLTKDAGGPLKWISNTWKEFSGQTAPAASESDNPTRLTMVTSSGRVEIWKVAWQGFTGAPLLGVGADNFVFQHYLLRNDPWRQPQHAHSIELQVLGETGIVGGVFAFGGILLALGGLLWPRCVAGWRGARLTWLRRSGPSTSRGLSRLCSARWGERSIEYGWEIGLTLGVLYWLVHASVDWLWQMAGVAIPMLLLLAAGLASIDARADILWPRWNRWLRIKSESGLLQTSPLPEEPREEPAAAMIPTAPAADKPSPRQRRRAKRRQRAAFLQPPGLLSHSFRVLMIALSLAVIIASGLSYLSIQYQRSALALAGTDGLRAVQRAEAAKWLQPADPSPYKTQATIYTKTARDAAGSGSEDRAGAVLDNLALSINSLEKAIAIEPVNWALHYRAGVATINLLLATAYAEGEDPGIDHADTFPLVPELEDWTSLSNSGSPLPAPGTATGSLAADETARALVAKYRDMSSSELATMAAGFLAAADQRNPLAVDVDEAIGLLQRLQAALS
jgi:hypothetical protein